MKNGPFQAVLSHVRRLVLIGFVLFGWLWSCQHASRTPDDDPKAFAPYISSFTTGFVSVKAPIQLQLAFQPNAHEATVPDGVIQLQPAAEGQWRWTGAQTLTFTPKNRLEANTLYQVTAQLGQLLPQIDAAHRQFHFSFKTYTQDFEVEPADLQSYSPNYYFQYIHLRAADHLERSAALQLLQAEQNGHRLHIKYQKSLSTPWDHVFVVDSIKRAREQGSYSLRWKGDAAGVPDQQGQLDLPVPAQGQCQVVAVRYQPQAPNPVCINFSEPLDRRQDFRGLVQLSAAQHLQYKVQGNVLKVFFEEGNELPEPVADSVRAYQPEEAPDPMPDKNLSVFPGIRTSGGLRLDQTYTQTLQLGYEKPNVRWLKNGHILPTTNRQQLWFEAASLKAVDVVIYKVYSNNMLQFMQSNGLNGSENLLQVGIPIARKTVTLRHDKLLKAHQWNTYALDLSSYIQQDPGALYRVEMSFRKKYALYPCTHADGHEDDNDPDAEDDNEAFTDYTQSNGSYYFYEDDYNWRESQDPCSDGYYYDTRIGRNVLATDIGIIAKRNSNQSVQIIATDLKTAKPLAGARVQVYGFQQQLLGTATTNTQGWAWFTPKRMVSFAVVSYGTQRNYLKLTDGESLSVSEFDVSGETLQKGLKGYVYGERGVWRPGDNIYLSFILNDTENPLPNGHPIALRINDPQGKTLCQQLQYKNDLNHYTFVVPTQASDPTGQWEARISVGGAHFYKGVKVETIAPNRLKIKNSLQGITLYAGRPNLNRMQVNWLHGAVAKNLNAEVTAKYSATATTFKGLSAYVFDDPSRSLSTEEQLIYAGKLNDQGQAQYPIVPQLQAQAPGMLQAVLMTRVHEEGGDVSTDVATLKYAPYAAFAGLQTPKANDYDQIETDKPQRLDLVCANAQGALLPHRKLEVRVYRLQSRWWWDSANDDLSQYNTATLTSAYHFQEVRTNAQGRAFVQLNIPGRDWGRYLIRVVDVAGGHACGKVVFFDQPYWAARAQNTDGDAAVQLRFAADKKTYQVGQTAHLAIPSAQGGRLLLSIENGAKVLQTLWVDTQKGQTKVELPIRADMAPHAYVHATLLQPHAQTLDDAPMRMYGIIPLEVIDPNSQLHPVIQQAAVFKPEQKVQIKVSEQQGKAMSYTLAIVDEGLLDLTRFKTPNAWDSFHARNALGVRTWDMFNDVIGAYGGRINQVFGIGGDQEAAGGKAKKAQRFKPVVQFVGPFRLAAGSQRVHDITLPKYIGSVRTMVVAANAQQQAYGCAEQTAAVRSPLMLLASFPRKLTPGEKVRVPVTVFAMEKNIRQVQLSIQTQGGLQVVGPRSQALRFAQPDEQMGYFDLQVTQATAVGKVQLVAVSGKVRTSYALEVDIYNPNPRTTAVQTLVLGPKQSKTLRWNAFGVAGSNTASLAVAGMPNLDVERRLNQLIQYPHGCVEQTTSAAFPQLYLADISTLSPAQQQRIQQRVNEAIRRLQQFQLGNGGFSYWPGQQIADDWSSSYAGHFLTEAEHKGYAVPAQMLSRWQQYQQRMARQWRLHDAADLNQAYRLYTLALAGKADAAAMNRLMQTPKLGREAQLRLAAAYAQLRQPQAGMRLLLQALRQPPSSSRFYDDNFGSDERNLALALETYLQLNQSKLAFDAAQRLAAAMGSGGWYSTQTTAYSLCVMAQFAQKMGGKGIAIRLQQGSKTQDLQSDKALLQQALQAGNGSQSCRLTNLSSSTRYVRLYNSGVLPVGREQPLSKNLEVQVVYKDRKGLPISLDNIAQGTSITAEIRVKNLQNYFVDHLALSHWMPSGFELVNTRLNDYGLEAQNQADYIDLRDDRANLYFGLKAGETKVFRLWLNASFLGQFYLPGTQCEHMYNPDCIGRTQGRWIRIVR